MINDELKKNCRTYSKRVRILAVAQILVFGVLGLFLLYYYLFDYPYGADSKKIDQFVGLYLALLAIYFCASSVKLYRHTWSLKTAIQDDNLEMVNKDLDFLKSKLRSFVISAAIFILFFGVVFLLMMIGKSFQ